jgi:iron complex transport system substrate-binding protein
MRTLSRCYGLIALLLSIVMLTGCGQTPSSTNPAPTVSPSVSLNQSLKPAARVVSLTSLSADIIYRLDKTKLVGISGSKLLSQNPNFAKLPRMNEERTPPNLEKIVALKPDLVIGAVGFHDPAIAKLKSLGIQTLLWEVDSWRSLTDLTQTLAEAIQADPTPLLKQYETFLDATPTPRASTLVLVSRQPLMSPNKKSWAGDLLAQFKVKNVVADLQSKSPIRGYITLSPEKLLETNPDSIILVNAPDGEIEKIKIEPFWSKLRATQAQRVYNFDYYGLVNPGSIDAIQKTCDRLKQVLMKTNVN